jgi:hypothetical protein
MGKQFQQASHENNYCHTTLVHSVCALLAHSYSPDFSFALDLAPASSLAIGWLHPRSGFQVYWGGAHLSVPRYQGIVMEVNDLLVQYHFSK